MSTAPSVPLEVPAGYAGETTPTIERANRLISVRSNPGFRDIVQISLDLVKSAADMCADYPGWDPQQIVMLKVRMQCAKEHHEILLANINEAIRAGLEEARTATLPQKTVVEAAEQGDYVRQAVLQKFEEIEGRAAGSY